MKRTLFLVALVLVSAVPSYAQSTNEFGVIFGGSRRFIDDAVSVATPPESDFIESNFSFSNNSLELYWAIPIEEGLFLKFKGGRVESEIGIPGRTPNPEAPNDRARDLTTRRDVRGDMAHVETLVEYRFDEPFGSTGLFGGLGYYRLSADDEDTQDSWGVTAGVTADFPITRRYGVVLEGSYHWIRSELQPRYMTVGGGLRVSF